MESKSIFQSKTMWGLALVVVAQVARMLGYDLGTEQAEALVNDLATLAGAGLAFYGRLKAVQPLRA